MNDTIIQIEVFGQKYKIRVKGEEDEKYIGLLTSYLDEKMQEVAFKSRSSDGLKIAVLAALNIADEYFLTRKQLDQMDEVMRRMENEIESLEETLSKEQAYSNYEEAIE